VFSMKRECSAVVVTCSADFISLLRCIIRDVTEPAKICFVRFIFYGLIRQMCIRIWIYCEKFAIKVNLSNC